MTRAPAAAVLASNELAAGYYLGPGRERLVLETPKLCLRAGDLVCVLGPNGCGKTTLIRTLIGLLPPLRGEVLLAGTPLRKIDRNERARRLAAVLTDRIDPGFLTVGELVALGRLPYTPWSGRMNTEDQSVVRRAITAVGLDALGDRRIWEISDGERQKAMIARAVAQRPELLVLDEPTAFLDLPSRVEVLQLLKRLAGDGGEAVLLSTHELDLALRLADTLWLIDGRGRLECGAPEDLVLNGAVARAFARPGMRFEPETAAFRPAASARGRIQVLGEGAEALWTVRALERIGFNPQRVPHADALETAVPVVSVIRVPGRGAGACWEYCSGESRAAGQTAKRRFDSLGELTGTLRGR